MWRTNHFRSVLARRAEAAKYFRIGSMTAAGTTIEKLRGEADAFRIY
jgi:hypothetical protein